MNIIAIDPSINNIGVAHLYNGKLLKSSILKTQGNTLVEKLTDISIFFKWQFTFLVDVDTPDKNIRVVIEIPDSWTRNNAESLMKLSMSIGAITASIGQLVQITDIYLAKVSEWKGKQSKEQTWNNAKLLLKLDDDQSEHERDAIALALWYNSKLKLERAMKNA